jgi:hypothetical protein
LRDPVARGRGWIKTKNREYWRYEMEREGAIRFRKSLRLRV